MAKLFNPNRDPEAGYMMRLSHAIAEHPGVAVALTLLMLVWFGLGGIALQDEYSGSVRPPSHFDGALTSQDLLFWGAAAGALLTLSGGWAWFHKQMAPADAASPAVEEKLSEEIQRFKQENSLNKREERLKRLREQGAKTGEDEKKEGL